MGFFRGAKNVLGHMFNTDVKGWLGYDNVKREFNSTLNLAQSLITPEVATHKETFEQAVARLGLSEQDLKEQKSGMMRNAIIFVLFAVALLIYGFWQLYNHHFIAALIVSCLMLYCLTQAFRFHFWVFQIEQRKLGCTFKQWVDYLLGS